MEKGKLVILGSINVDHVLNVDHFPRPGETLTGKGYHISFGGKGANQAVAAARSGADILFIASVGEDEVAASILFKLAEDKIDIHLIEMQKNMMTGVALIFVNEEGENCIGISAGANEMITPEYVKRHQAHIQSADALLMQLETPLESVQLAAEIASAAGTQVILNPAPARVLSDQLLKWVDVITPNETEAEQLTGITVNDEASAAQAAQVLHHKGVNTVIITLGSRGAWVSVAGQGELIQGFKVQAVDTTAAGDTFNGALVTALLEKQVLNEAVRFAHAAAAIAVTRQGAQNSVPTREEVEHFLARQ